jgi:hypothetical protein
MLKKFILFFVANFLFVLLVIAIYGTGYEYDKRNKLYPESKELSYDLSMSVYGERWVRLAKVMLGTGFAIDAVLLMFWYRNLHKRTQIHIIEGTVK